MAPIHKQAPLASSAGQAAMKPAIFLMGPTASGKTDLAMRLCDEIACEIISVDSALVYRGMDIGTAKPGLAERTRYPHHLIDIIDPAESYSVARFRADALALMADIVARGKVPLLVGGTMLYFRALLHGIGDLPDADTEVRAQISADAEAFGWDFVHRQLAEVDPVSAARINPNDPQRLQRALEVFLITGVSMTAWREREQQDRQGLPYRLLQLAIAPDDRAILHRRIARRFAHMLAQGFEQEVRELHARPDLHAGLPSIRSVGYRQMWSYLEGEYDFARMQEKSIVATRQLAKRQLTWLRSWQDLDWIYTDSRHEGIAGMDLAAALLPQTLNLVKERLELAV